MKFKEGQMVYFHPITGKPHDGKIYTIGMLGFIPSSKIQMAWLNGKSGCVSTKNLSPAQ